MKKIILKRYPDLLSPREKLLRFLARIFKERTIIVNRSGRLAQYRFSPALQSVIALLAAAFVGWTLHATRVYMESFESLAERDRHIADARAKFDAALADIRAYRDTIEGLSSKLAASHDRAVDIALAAKGVEREQKDALMKERVKLSAELSYVGGELDRFARSVSWANIDAESYKNTKSELEKNLVINENIALKKRNAMLEVSVHDMAQLQGGLIDKVQVLAESGIKDLEKTLSQVDIILSQVNLKDRGALVAKVAAEKEDGLGGGYIPLKNISLADVALDAKFRAVASRVNLWEGLDKSVAMLPLGRPIKGDFRITSPYGVRDDPFLNMLAMHNGIDFAGQVGTPLYSTARGKVIQAGRRGDYGLSVEVYHGLGFSTLYAHLSRISVENGDIIESGTKVGLAGSSGRSTAPHLHYELRHNGRTLNPYAFVKAESHKE